MGASELPPHHGPGYKPLRCATCAAARNKGLSRLRWAKFAAKFGDDYAVMCKVWQGEWIDRNRDRIRRYVIDRRERMSDEEREARRVRQREYYRRNRDRIRSAHNKARRERRAAERLAAMHALPDCRRPYA